MAASQDAIDILCEVFPDRIEDVLDTQSCISYTVYDEDEYPVGAVIYSINVMEKTHLQYIFVHWIGVRYRGIGIGTKLLDYLHQQYPQYWFSLMTEKSNTNAIKFYRKMGYFITGLCKDTPIFWHLQRVPTTGDKHVR